MKRPPQLWVLSIGLLCLSLSPTTNALRATSLIFGKSSTTSTTEAPTEGEATTIAVEVSTEANNTVTKPPLTGNPQIDYIWDPNLPFELKNYNLSDYPFYDGLPEEINFKCDGLHDGFYASVPHKCQVYHHCLYGTRYDFLCANFTAFDQRTFICHFASEVDCVNSPNFFHRNDNLYEATTTTTPSTTTVLAVVTPSPALSPSLRRPPAGVRRRRPYRRRRPQYDYYYDEEDEYETDRDRDDYYDDPPVRAGSRRKRPRPNRRPEYDDRRPTGGSKNNDRRVEDDEDRRSTDDRRRPDDRKPLEDRRRPASDDRRTDDDYDRRPYDRPRKQPSRDRYDEDKEDDRRSYDRPRKTGDDKTTERRPYERPRKPEDEERRYRPKDSKSSVDDKDDRRSYERPRKPADEDSRRSRPKESKPEETKVLIRPSSGSSVYDRPRAPPIIRRPVPKTERDKFGYKPAPAAKIPASKLPEDEEYYDDYEEEPKLPAPKPTRKAAVDSRESDERRAGYGRPRRPQSTTRRPVDDVVEEVRRPLPKRTEEKTQERPLDRSRYDTSRRGSSSKSRPVVVEEEEEYIEEYEEDKPSSKQETSSRERDRSKLSVKESRDSPATRIESTTNASGSKEREHRVEPVVKIVKRPFLPSRGGNPYSARGLQPVGSKALDITDKIEQQSRDESPLEEEPKRIENNRQSRPSGRTNNQPNYQNIQSSEKSRQQSEEVVYYDDEEEFKPVTSRSKNDFRQNFRNEQPRTTQRPKASDNFRNPLDINENEYDVTLNDALNPTLPNLPIRSVPTGFSPGRDGFVSQNYQRPRLISVDSAALSPASSEYVYQVKQPQGAQIQSVRYNPYVTVQQQQNYRHPTTASGQYYTAY